MLKILTTKGQRLLKSVFYEKFNAEPLLKTGRGGPPFFLLLFLYKELFQPNIRVSYIVSYAAMGENADLFFEKTSFSSLKAFFPLRQSLKDYSIARLFLHTSIIFFETCFLFFF